MVKICVVGWGEERENLLIDSFGYYLEGISVSASKNIPSYSVLKQDILYLFYINGRKNAEMALDKINTLKEQSGDIHVKVILEINDNPLHHQYLREKGADLLTSTDSSLADIIQSVKLIIDLFHNKNNNQNQKNPRHNIQEFNNMFPGVFYQFKMEPGGKYYFTYLSDKVETIWQLPVGLIREDPDVFFAMIHEEDVKGVMKSISSSFSTLNNFDKRFRFNHPEKGSLLLSASAHPVRQKDGSVIWNGSMYDVSNVMQEEERVRYLSLIAENTDNIVIITDKERKIEYVNTPFLRLTGYAENEVMGQSPGELLQAEDQDQKQVEEMKKLFDEGKPYKGEILNFTKNGKPYWLFMDIQPIKNMKGEVLKFLAIETDITESKKREEELKQSEERFRMLAENASDGFAITNGDGIIEYISASHEKHYGYPVKDIIGTRSSDIMQYLHPEDRDNFHAGVLQAIKDRVDKQKFVFRIKTKWGAYRWREDTIWFYYDENGNYNKLITITRDIHDSVISEQTVRNERNNLKVIMQSSPVGLLVMDRTETIVMANKTAEKLFSRKFDELFKRRCGEFIGCIEAHNGAKVCGKNKNCSNCKLYSGIRYVLKNKKSLTDKEAQTILLKPEGPQKHWLRFSIEPLILDGKDHIILALTDVTSRKIIENELTEEKQKLELVFDTIPLRVFWKNKDLQYLGANKAFLDDMGLENVSDLIGKTVFDFPDSNVYARQYHDEEKTIIRTGVPKLSDIEIYKSAQKNKTTYFETNKSPLRDHDGQIIGIIGTYIDVTKQKEAQKLENELLVAQKTAKVKQTFLSNMSHEMRTPLNGIIGISEILKNTDLDDQQRHYLSIIEQSSDSLLSLINSVLDLSKIEAGKVELIPTTIDSRAFQTRIDSLYASLTAQKNLGFSFELSNDFPPFFVADENKITQIINNLVGNAIKFTETGSITLKGQVKEKKSDHFILQISVIDTGIGIPDNKLNQIFGEFTQIDDSKTRMREGTGLGLAITYSLVKLHGGKIDVKSRLKKGTEFAFTFRAEPADQSYAQALKEEPMDDIYDLGINILVAEDKQVNRLVAKLMLEKMGCKTTVVNNGLEAVEKVKDHTYDVVLMDIQMPVMDGVTAVKQIRKMKKKLPVIIGLSAEAMEGDREKYIHEGMDDYITKPIKSKVLLKCLKKWQNRKFPHSI